MDSLSSTDVAATGSAGSAPVVRTTALTRTFRRQEAVVDVDLLVRPGKVYGLLGPNGAGKSTTLRMLLGLLPPTSGEIDLFDVPWQRAALGRIGASIDGPSIYGHLSAAANLRVHSTLLGLDDSAVARASARAGLHETGRKKAGTFSTGMRGRLALAVALLGEPELLLLDEPQNGLDPEGIASLRQTMTELVSHGRTIVLSSHLLSEVAQVADDVGVLVGGRLVFQGPLETMAPDGDLERAYFHLTAGARA